MPSSEQIRKLLTEVTAATESKGLSWSETADDEEFISLMSGGKHLLKMKSYSFVDEEGDRVGYPSLELHRGSDETLLLRVAVSQGIDEKELQTLYQMVRNKALGIDAAVEAVLQELEELNDIPF